MITKEGSTQIINFMTPGAGVLANESGHIDQIVKIHYFYKILLLYYHAEITQTKYIIMITKERSTKIENFHDPRGWGSDVRAWPYKSL